MKKVENDPVDPVDKPSYEELVTKVKQLERTPENKILLKVQLTHLLSDNVPGMIW